MEAFFLSFFFKKIYSEHAAPAAAAPILMINAPLWVWYIHIYISFAALEPEELAEAGILLRPVIESCRTRCRTTRSRSALILLDPCFPHGQLYVARASDISNVFAPWLAGGKAKNIFPQATQLQYLMSHCDDNLDFLWKSWMNRVYTA